MIYEDVLKHFDMIERAQAPAGFSPKDEIFPTDNIFIINNENEPEMVHWTIRGEASGGKVFPTINAKSENVSFTPMFKDAFRHGRCLVPATSFFEWKDVGKPKKERWEFFFDEPIVAFAGISRLADVKGEQKRCAVILTTDANDVVRPIHAKNRMPVVLHKEDYTKWLDNETSFEELRRMMRPFPNEEMRAEPVGDPGKLF